MGNITIIILLLAIITALAEVADRVKIPYPILLVLVGIGVSLVPGLPAITLDSETIFLIFLPPVLYSAAWSTDHSDGRFGDDTGFREQRSGNAGDCLCSMSRHCAGFGGIARVIASRGGARPARSQPSFR